MCFFTGILDAKEISDGGSLKRPLSWDARLFGHQLGGATGQVQRAGDSIYY